MLGFILMLRAKHKLKIDGDSRIFSSSGFEAGLVHTWGLAGVAGEGKDPAAPGGNRGEGCSIEGPPSLLASPEQCGCCSLHTAFKFYCWKNKLKATIFTGWVWGQWGHLGAHTERDSFLPCSDHASRSLRCG